MTTNTTTYRSEDDSILIGLHSAETMAHQPRRRSSCRGCLGTRFSPGGAAFPASPLTTWPRPAALALVQRLAIFSKAQALADRGATLASKNRCNHYARPAHYGSTSKEWKLMLTMLSIDMTELQSPDRAAISRQSVDQAAVRQPPEGGTSVRLASGWHARIQSELGDHSHLRHRSSRNWTD